MDTYERNVEFLREFPDFVAAASPIVETVLHDLHRAAQTLKGGVNFDLWTVDSTRFVGISLWTKNKSIIKKISKILKDLEFTETHTSSSNTFDKVFETTGPRVGVHIWFVHFDNVIL